MIEYISKEDISRVLLERTGANKSCLSNARERRYDEGEQYFQKLVFEDEQIASLIEELPTADARPNIHGHWKVGFGNTWCSCSECSGNGSTNWSYCPWCGADMRGEQ